MQRRAAVAAKVTPRGANGDDGAAPVIDPERFILQNLRLAPVPFLHEISLYLAHPRSGLRRLGGRDDANPADPPYWAYPWAGGAALARHILDHPEIVRGRSVLDIGSGSGLVGIAAALSGAALVTAAEIDPHGRIALALNARANGVALSLMQGDPLKAAPPFADVVTAGDVFYHEGLAARMLPLLQSLRDQGSLVLVGDPGRAHLPRERLLPLAEYRLADFAGTGDTPVTSVVYTLAPTGDTGLLPL